tara:strand:+ start:3833 stop:4102 length:270 start_codon:yes stop_codon:yes gene_type:complete
MAKSQYSGSIPYGWYPDWLVNWYTGSQSVDLEQTLEVFNTVYPKTGSKHFRDYILLNVTSSWNSTQKEEMYELYLSSSMQGEFSGSLGL